MNQTAQNPRKKLLWSLLFVAIAAATVGVVVSQGRSFTLASFASYVGDMSKPWLAAAAAAMLGYILFEGEAVAAVCRSFGHPVSCRRGFAYAASDIYFSAITPSATGGQPACAFLMIRDGIPPMVTTLALVLNLTMHTASILALGAAALILQPELFLGFQPLGRALIAVGYLTQVALAVFFLLLLRHETMLRRICRGALRLLCRLRLVRREEERQRALDRHMEEYARCARLASARKGMMAKVFLCNLIQRACVIAVPALVFLASGGRAADAGRVWAAQCYAVIGSYTVPVPGAMGVSDYLMLDGFGRLLSGQGVVNFELLSRAMSFYACVLLCGAATLAYWLRARRRRG